jgi:hypothetical protein
VVTLCLPSEMNFLNIYLRDNPYQDGGLPPEVLR